MESFYNFVNAYCDPDTGALCLPIEIRQENEYLQNNKHVTPQDIKKYCIEEGDQVMIEVITREALLLGISVIKFDGRVINNYEFGGAFVSAKTHDGIPSIIVPKRLAAPFIENCVGSSDRIKRFEVWLRDDGAIVYYPIHSGRFAARPTNVAHGRLDDILQDSLGNVYGKML